MAHPNPTLHEHDPRWTSVDSYTFTHLHLSSSSSTPSPKILDATIRNCRANNLPDIAVSPSQGKFLMLQARLQRATRILEVGTLGGYSTIWLAHARPDVRITTVEINEEHARVARRNLTLRALARGLTCWWGLDVLPRLRGEAERGARERFEFVFVDADKENSWVYFDESVRMCGAGACIVVDNVVRRGLLADEEVAKGDSRVMGGRVVVENVGRDERVDAVVMQTVGEKNYDGFLMAVVRGS